MENKTKTIKIRVTPTCYEKMKQRSVPFHTMTNFINRAVEEFSDVTAKEKLDLETNIAKQYAAMDAKLAHVGASKSDSKTH